MFNFWRRFRWIETKTAISLGDAESHNALQIVRDKSIFLLIYPKGYIFSCPWCALRRVEKNFIFPSFCQKKEVWWRQSRGRAHPSNALQRDQLRVKARASRRELCRGVLRTALPKLRSWTLQPPPSPHLPLPAPFIGHCTDAGEAYEKRLPRQKMGSSPAEGDGNLRSRRRALAHCEIRSWASLLSRIRSAAKRNFDSYLCPGRFLLQNIYQTTKCYVPTLQDRE